MPIILNGTTFNNGGTAKFNGTNLTEIKFGSTTVWKAETVYYKDGTMSVPFSIGVNYNNAGSVSNTNGYLQVTTNEDTSYMSTNTIDLTGISTLIFTVSYYTASASPSYVALLVGNSRTARVYNGTWLKKDTKTATGTFSVDVSSISGSHYIGFGVINGTARVTSIVGQ